MKDVRCIRTSNGQIIKSPKIHFKKTETFIRQGVGTQSPEIFENAATDKKSIVNSPDEITFANDKIMQKGIVVIDPLHLIDGILFRAMYLGTTQLVCEGRPTKSLRMMQAEEAVTRIKVRWQNY